MRRQGEINMKIAFQVITRISEDNWYSSFAYKEGKNLIVDDEIPDDIHKKMFEAGKLYDNVHVKGPFRVGEIIIVDPDTGREHGYPRRKAGKWDVDYKQFRSLERAIKFSQKLMRKGGVL
jgi:hypothetical protein